MTIAADLSCNAISIHSSRTTGNGRRSSPMIWWVELPHAHHRPSGTALGAEEVVGFVTWFLGAVEQFRFFDLTVYACADPDVAVAEVKAEARIKPTGRLYRQEYVVFLRAAGGKIAFLREYFNPQAAQAMDAPILDLTS